MPDAEGERVSQTRAMFQRRTQRELSREDVREIIENAIGFFRILAEWKTASAETNNPKGEAAHAVAEDETGVSPAGRLREAGW